MPMGCGGGIHNGGFGLYPGSDHVSAHGTGGKTDTRSAAYPFDLPSVRQGVDIQDTLVFSKPYRGLDGRPIPFETLQVEIPLRSDGSQMRVMHGNAFMRDAVACYLVPLYQECGDRPCRLRLMVSETLRRHTASTREERQEMRYAEEVARCQDV